MAAILSRVSGRSLQRSLRGTRALSSGSDGTKGSSYENYSVTSKTYDAYRRPIGLDVITGALEANAAARGMKSTDMKLLDAGCGSGNYLNAVRPSIGSGTGLEFNEGMIEQANSKFGPGSGVEIVQGSITDMPFEDNMFDAALTTQVLHHLVRAGSTDGNISFNNVALACKELSRCLKPGGVWVVSTQTPEQHVDGFWWAPVVPDAAATLAAHFPPLDLFESLLKEAGFETVTSTIPPVPLVDLELYLDIEGPFTQEFRNADSTWSLATPEELEAGLAMLKAKIDAGEAEAWLAEREELRAKIGQTTTVIATKPMA